MTNNLGFDVNPGGTRLVIAQLVFLVLAWIVCLLRAHVKLYMTKKILLDDWLMLVALLVYTAYGIIAVQGVISGGTGRHTSELTRDGIESALRAWYLCEVLYAPLSALIRTSIALFLLRLASKPLHVWTIRINMVVIWLISIIYFFLMALQCLPPNYFWQGPVHAPGVTGSCMDHNVVPIATIVHSCVSAISDWVLGLLPIAMLWNVSINRRTKFSIAVLLGMGLIAGVALIVRIPYVKKIAISADFLFETIELAVWSVIEPSLGIMAGSIAAIRPLFKTWGFGLKSTRRYASKQLAGSGEGAQKSSQNAKKLTGDGSTACSGPSRSIQQSGSGSSCVSDQEMQTVETVLEQHAAERKNAPAWDVERGVNSREEEDSERDDGINAHSSTEILAMHGLSYPKRMERVHYHGDTRS